MQEAEAATIIRRVLSSELSEAEFARVWPASGEASQDLQNSRESVVALFEARRQHQPKFAALMAEELVDIASGLESGTKLEWIDPSEERAKDALPAGVAILIAATATLGWGVAAFLKGDLTSIPAALPGIAIGVVLMLFTRNFFGSLPSPPLGQTARIGFAQLSAALIAPPVFGSLMLAPLGGQEPWGLPWGLGIAFGIALASTCWMAVMSRMPGSAGKPSVLE